MIELRTGVPGSGKTLSAVQRLSTLISRWSAHPEEARPIFVSGIPDLSLPHSPVPLKSVQITKAGTPSLVPDWDLMPDGSLVIIDECQGVFPPRSSASASPDHVSWLNTHRHRGFDIWLMTQHPKLIDGTVRALVGKHQHYRRLFGGMRAAVYEWDACSDSLSGMKSAIISHWSYPKKVYQWYKSAEVHTKQSFKLPRWLIIPFVGIALGIFFFPKAVGILTNGISGKAIAAPETVPVQKIDLGKPEQTAKGGALAPPVAVAPVDFSKPFASDSEDSERPISELKKSYGVYSDDDDLVPHFSPSEKLKQIRNSQIVDNHLIDEEFSARAANAQVSSVVYHN